MARLLKSKQLDDIDIKNMDESHFINNMDNVRTCGASEIKTAGMTTAQEGLILI